MKHKRIDLDVLKTQCRETALGDLPWETLLANICDWLGGDRAMMMYAAHGEPYKASFSHNHDMSVLAKYNENYNGSDPRMPFSKLTRPGMTRTGQQYVPNSEIKDTDYFNVISINTDICDSVHSVIMDSPILGRQAISVRRGFKNEFFESSSTDQMQALLPYLTDAYQYSIRVSGRLDPHFKNECCCLLIDKTLRGTLLNGEPLDILADCESLGWNGEYLRPKNLALREFLSLAIQRARSGISSRCRLKTDNYSLQAGPSFLEISVLPRPRFIDWLPDIEGKVMIHIAKASDIQQSSNAEVFRKIFKLTKSETRTLMSLLKTGDMRQAAQESNVSYETMRWHLKNIFNKTGYNKKETLLRAVSEMDLSNSNS